MTPDEKQRRGTADAAVPRQRWEAMRLKYVGHVVELVLGGGGGDGKLSQPSTTDLPTGKKPEGMQ